MFSKKNWLPSKITWDDIVEHNRQSRREGVKGVTVSRGPAFVRGPENIKKKIWPGPKFSFFWAPNFLFFWAPNFLFFWAPNFLFSGPQIFFFSGPQIFFFLGPKFSFFLGPIFSLIAQIPKIWSFFNSKDDHSRKFEILQYNFHTFVSCWKFHVILLFSYYFQLADILSSQKRYICPEKIFGTFKLFMKLWSQIPLFSANFDF